MISVIPGRLRVAVGLVRGLAACLAIILAGASSLLHAQALSGVSGTVTDQQGQAIDGAKVTLTGEATGVTRETLTSSGGVYTIVDLTPGTYTVTFTKDGFQPAARSVRTEVSRRLNVNATLMAGTITETVDVEAPAEVQLETSVPEVGWTLERKVLQELPISFGSDVGDRGRQIETHLTLVPGVTGDAFSHRINGGADMQNEIVFEGVPVAQSETQGYQSHINPPYDMVQEFRVVGSTFSALYGPGQGALTYKFATGTNTLHGSAFEILRNEGLNAAGHTPLEPGKPDRDRRHNFGGSLSGPVRIPGLYDGRDKTFFHGTVEWFRLNQPFAGQLSLPTAAMKRGDFSAFPQTIYVPDSRYLVPGCTPGAPAGQPFPGNIIPQNCFSSISKGILGLFPDPVFPGFSRNAPSQLTDAPTRQTNWGITLDHRLGANQNLRVSYWRNTYDVIAQTNGAFFTNELSGFKDEPRLGNGIFATYSNVFGGNLIMTAGFGYLREQNNQYNQFQNVSFPGIANGTTFPTIDFQGNFAPNDLGADDAGLSFSINNKKGYSFANNWLYTQGRHTFNWGFTIKRSSQESQECQRCGGRFDFSPNTTANPADLNNTGSSFASFLLGIANFGRRSFTPEKFLTNFLVSPYIQDEFRLNRNLTITAGLRWDIMRPFSEKNDRVVFVDLTRPNPGATNPKTGQPLLGAVTKFGDCPECAGYRRADIVWTNLSPRLGAVYQLNEKTVLSVGSAVTRLTGGTFEYGTNKAANDYSELLAGQYRSLDPNLNIPGYGQWDGNPMPAPPAPPFGPTIANGFGGRQFTTDGRAPYAISWTAGVQRELPWDLLFAATYVGNRANHLPSFRNPDNQLDPKFLDLCTGNPNDCVLQKPWTSPEAQAVLQGLGFGQCNGYYTPYCEFFAQRGTAIALANALRPYPQFDGLRNNFETNGSSFYNALQASIQRRHRNGLGFLVSYTLAKSLQAGDDSGFSTFNGQPLNKFDPRAEWGVGDNDRRHNIAISGVYELPIKPQGGVAKALLSGWQVSGTLFYRNGIPVDRITANGSPLLTGNRANYDPSVPLGVNWSNAQDAFRSPEKNKDGIIMFPSPLPGEATPFDVFNIAAFSSPGRGRPGTATRRIDGLVRPWETFENMALAKHFYVGKVDATLRVEFFNVFNRTGYCSGDVGRNVDDRDTFGLVRARRVRNSAGQVIGVQVQECQEWTPRRGQIFLRVGF